MSVGKLYEALFEQLTLAESPLVNLLNDGISKLVLNDTVKNLSIHLPDVFYNLYE